MTERRTSPARRALRRMATVLVGVGVTAATLLFGAGAAHADGYEYYQTDTIQQWDASGSAVYVDAQLNWYKDGWMAPQYRGRYAGYIQLNKQGCIWYKITWRTVTGTVSWPPSGSAASVSDGYARACGEAGTWVDLQDVNDYSSHELFGSVLCAGYSRYVDYTVRRYDTCQSSWD